MSNLMLMIPIIFIIILLILFIVFLMITSRQEKVLKTVDENGKVKAEQINQETNSVTKNKMTTDEKKETQKREDVFKFMEFDRIMDNMIVQNGGSRFTMAIRCKGINYALMSEMEQLSVEEGFITFLNTLKYPIQLYVQAQNIDLKGNVAKYKKNIESLNEDYSNINEEYNKVASQFDADERVLNRLEKQREKITNVYEYAHDIIKYVEKMSTNKNLLQRKFYVLVSYNTAEISSADKFTKDELIEMCATELMTRCKGIISALSSCSVSGKILDSNELADLLYSAYNRDDKSLMSVKEAIDSGMLRLYSTSEDAIHKKEMQLDDYLNKQAQLRAYKAIKYAKEHNEIETPASEMINQEEEISRRATNYIKNSDYDSVEKDIAAKKILSDFRNDKKELNEIHNFQKETIEKEAEKDIQKIPELENAEKPEGIKLIEKSRDYEKIEKEKQEQEANNIQQINENNVQVEDESKVEENNSDNIRDNVQNEVEGSINDSNKRIIPAYEKNDTSNNSTSDNQSGEYVNIYSSNDEDETII